jgi:hypothetical protein
MFHNLVHIIPEENEDHLIKSKKIIEINLPCTTISLKQDRNPTELQIIVV